jgi:hypothetical protein
VIERSKPASDKSKSRVQVDNEVSFKMQNEAKSWTWKKIPHPSAGK